MQSTLRAGLRFPAVLRALFPCGSITGAPKVHTMDLIADLEREPRGLYCGAIGWIDAPTAASAAGDFCLSVAIRTLLLGPQQQGRRAATLGVGGGIVLDSEAGDEFAETQAKARFLTQMDPGFTLFETMRVSHGRVRHLAQHLQRLQASAHSLGFRYVRGDVQRELSRTLLALDASQCYRLRLDLHQDGRMHCTHAPLIALPAGPAGLVLSASALPTQESALLNHKTALRTGYDSAIQKAMAQGAFDTVFVNEHGKVTEGARSNLFAKIQGRWYTPPLASGVLNGVQRQRLLERCSTIAETALTLQEVLDAEALVVCSALRGLQRAAWLRDAQGQVIRV